MFFFFGLDVFVLLFAYLSLIRPPIEGGSLQKLRFGCVLFLAGTPRLVLSDVCKIKEYDVIGIVTL